MVRLICLDYFYLFLLFLGDLLMQFASKVNDTQSDDDNEDNSEEASGENTGPVTKFISISTIGCNNTTVNNINVNKSLKNRSESATNFDSTMSSKSYNNSSLRTNRSKDNEGGDNEAARNNEIWTDDGAIHVDQSSFLSCSTPLSQVDRGCNYEDEDEDEETVSNCYDNCDTQKNVRIISIDNIKSEDTVIQHRASPFILRNHDGNKDITDADTPIGATRVEIKSEFNTELKINDETKLNVLVTVPSIGDRPSPPTATTQPAVTATQKQKHSLPSLLLGGEES